MLKNEKESYVRIRGRGLKKSYVPLHGGRGAKNCQNDPYIINEWHLTDNLLNDSNTLNDNTFNFVL